MRGGGRRKRKTCKERQSEDHNKAFSVTFYSRREVLIETLVSLVKEHGNLCERMCGCVCDKIIQINK